MKYFYLACTLMGMLFCNAYAKADTYEDHVFDSKQSIKEFMEINRIPHLEFAVIKNNDVVQVERLAINEKSLSTPVFNVASLAKPVFSALVLNLVDKGLWTLDTPISEMREDDSLKHHPWLKKLTTRRILAHRSGFPNWREGQALTFEFEPGTQMQYSGEGYEYLQTTLERQLGMPLEAIFQRYLKSELAVEDLHFSVPNTAYEQKITSWFDKNGQAYPMHDHTSASAADNLTSTIQAYGKFVQFMIDGANISPHLYREMLSPQGQPGDAFQMGLGWEILDIGQGTAPIYLHSGSDKGVNSIAIFSVAHKEGLVIFTNSDNGKKLFKPLIRNYLSFGAQMTSSH